MAYQWLDGIVAGARIRVMRTTTKERPLGVFIYVMSDGARSCKVGKAQNPEIRRASLQAANPRPIEILGTYLVPREAAGRLEKAIHERLSGSGVLQRGEWFECAPEDVTRACETVLSEHVIARTGTIVSRQTRRRVRPKAKAANAAAARLIRDIRRALDAYDRALGIEGRFGSDIVEQLLAQGLSRKRISELTGIPRSTLYRMCAHTYPPRARVRKSDEPSDGKNGE